MKGGLTSSEEWMDGGWDGGRWEKAGEGEREKTGVGI